MKQVLLSLFIAFNISSFANFPLVRNFTRENYKSGTQNWAIAQDKSNAMYFANNSGLLAFDGTNWTTYPIKNETNVRSLLYTNDGRFYASSFNEIGYFHELKNGKFKYQSLIDKLDKSIISSNELFNIYQGDKKIFFQSNQSIFEYDGKTIKSYPFNNKIDASAYVHNVLFVASEQKGLFMLNGDLFVQLPGSELLLNKRVCAILPFKDKKILLVTSFNGVFIFDGSSIVPYNTGFDDFLKSNQVFCATTNGKQLVFGTVQRGIVVKNLMDDNIIYVNTFSGLQNNTVLSVAFDNQQNLWLGLDKGIDYVMLNCPVMNILGEKNLYGAGYTSFLKNNTMYFGTNQGLYTTLNDIDYKSLWETISSGIIWKGEFCNKKKNGDIFWESAAIAPIINESGNITHYVAVKEDISEYKSILEELTKSEEKFRLLVENSHDIIYILSSEGEFIFVSLAWTKLLGQQLSDVVGKNFQNFVYEDDIPNCLLYLKSIIANEKPSSGVEYRVLHIDGTWRWHYSSAIPLKDETGKIIGIYGIARDITQEKRLDNLIATAVTNNEENQRKSFAQELHDGLGPMLSSIKTLMKLIEIQKDKTNINPLLNQINDIINESFITIRELSNNLSPNILVNHGLNVALKEYLINMKKFNIKISYEYNITNRFKNNFEIALYRVITEMITNSIKHANASQIDISLYIIEDMINFEYFDNGCGFNVELMLKSNKG
ncbi:MAG: PAS domain S-box protein, partial [Paludibacter sp.]